MTETYRDAVPDYDAGVPPITENSPATYGDDALGTDASASSRHKGGFGRWLIETILLVILAFLLAQGIKTFVIQPFVIPTGSMIPTIEIQDRVLAEKMSVRFSEPEVGDVVVFDDIEGVHPQLIKRVIATEGQVLDIVDGQVFVDGNRLDEPYVHEKRTDPGSVPLPLTIPDGHIWLMGDNRPNSGDSRFIGPVPVSAVRGKAFFTYWPPSRMAPLR